MLFSREKTHEWHMLLIERLACCALHKTELKIIAFVLNVITQKIILCKVKTIYYGKHEGSSKEYSGEIETTEKSASKKKIIIKIR